MNDDAIMIRLPAHKAGLHISHNEHKNYYETTEQWVSEYQGSWKDDESRARAIATDSIWTLQWYPDTPVGFYVVSAPTLDEVLVLALEVEAAEAKKP